MHDDTGRRFLSDAVVDHWTAPSLRNDPIKGLDASPEQEWIQFLQTGRSERLAAFGGMSDVVTHSIRYLDPADVADIVTYLKTLPVRPTALVRSRESDSATQIHHFQTRVPGASEYLDNCVACHRSDGRGYAGVFPALAGNPVLQSERSEALIHIILTGARSSGSAHQPASFTRPGFASRLDDAAIAWLAGFVPASWGNQGPAVQAEQVKAMRAALHLEAPVAARP